MAEVFEYDTVAANNNSSPPDGWPENMAPSAVNDCAREMQAADARDLADRNGTRTSAGTAPSYTLTSSRTITALSTGLIQAFTAHASNGGAASTLNLNSLGAASLVLPDGSDPDIVAGGIYIAIYDGTNWQVVSATTPQAAVPTLVAVSGSRNLASADRNGPILNIGTALTLTLAAAMTSGDRVRILNYQALSFNLSVTLAGTTIYRADSSSASPLTTGDTETLAGNAYTLIAITTTNYVLMNGIL